ncbi:MAG: sigma-70 family RNA polymerase sigma factor [Bacteroidales bacterium]|nr:sigma-70 family RNA polymerase sigma factor [Bacteroidales bacterium]
MISQDEEIELAERIQNGDKNAIEKLVNANLRFVISVAKQYSSKNVETMDIISAGNIGLIKAAWRFDHTKGFKFISYAVWWIRQSIQKFLHENSEMIRRPANVRIDNNQINTFSQRFYAKNGRYPTNDEMLSELNISEKSISNKNDIVRGDHSVAHDDSHIGWDIMSGGIDEDRLRDEDKKPVIFDAMQSLSETEKTIIIHSYGFGVRQKRYDDIQYMLGYQTTERVRQLYHQALSKLRKKSKLKEFV